MTNVVQFPAPTTTQEEAQEHTKQVPDFITRKDIDAMNDDELDQLVSAIQVRRMKAVGVYKKTKEEKEYVTQE